MNLREVLFKLGTEYQKERASTLIQGRQPRIPKGHKFASWVRRDIPLILENKYKKELSNLEVHASPGITNWANSPWIVILDPKTCTQSNGRVSVQAGFYAGYHFARNEKKIMFFLGQAEHNIKKNYPSDKVDLMLESRAMILKRKVPEYKKYFLDVSKSSAKKESKMKDRWINSSAFGAIYKTKDLPTEHDLLSDLNNMIKLYKLAIERGGVLEGQSNKIYIDQYATGSETKIKKHVVKEIEIIEIDEKLISQLKKNSDYTCQACGLKYEKVYGDYSKKKDFIEAHHIEPKSRAKEKAKINEKLKRSAKDFAMLCANCHRMIHRMMSKEKDRIISLKEFKERINSKFKDQIKQL